MARPRSAWFVWTALLLLCGLAAQETAPNAARTSEQIITLPENSPTCMHWAATEWAAVVRARKLPCGPFPERNSVRVLLVPAHEPESFAITKSDTGAITVTASDATGAMYGLLELAEQLGATPQHEGLAEPTDWVQPVTRKPHLAIRALNLFVHVEPNGQLSNWFKDEQFWTSYFELMAHSRFNVLDLHGAYCPASSAFSSLVQVFTNTDPAQPNPNLETLKKIVTRARERGIRVALMNYLNGPQSQQGQLADRVEQLLRACPDLWALGMRGKRTGDEALRPFETCYLRPARSVGFQGAFLTRSWGTDKNTLTAMSRLADGRLWVEVKYNGEHLGLPYPAILGWGEDYSFQDFLLPKRNFQVLWQVRSNGTHRVFPWGDSAFVRRAANSFRLGQAAGFSIEAPLAYYSPETNLRYAPMGSSAPKSPAEKYLLERHALWHLLWGRLTYDPSTPDDVFIHTLAQRYGHAGGAAAFKTYQAMSRIVPKVYASYALGIDHRDAAPELEIGAALRDHKEWRSLEQLAAIQPLDRARYASPLEFARQKSADRLQSTRIGPLESAAKLEEDAALTLSAAVALECVLKSEAGTQVSLSPDPGTLLVLSREARALAHLGRSHAARLRGLTAYAFWLVTADARWLPKAREHFQFAAAAWKELARIADVIYQPLNDPLRMGNGYRWGSVQPHFERLLMLLEKDLAKARNKKRETVGEPDLAGSFVPPVRAVPPTPKVACERQGSTLKISLQLEGGTYFSEILLMHRPLRSEPAWEATRFEWVADSGAYRAEIREPVGGVQYYFTGSAAGRPWLWPNPESELPYLLSKKDP